MSKKAKKKQGGMSEEERLLLMQHKAQAEEEQARRKEDMLDQFLKEKLVKEEQQTEQNIQKLKQQWRALALRTQCADLHEDFAILNKNFRVIDNYDSIIANLVADLAERRQQSEMSRNAHLDKLDSLFTFHKNRVEKTVSDFCTELDKMSSVCISERKKIMLKHEQGVLQLEDVIFSMEQSEARLHDKKTVTKIKKMEEEVADTSDNQPTTKRKKPAKLLSESNEAMKQKIETLRKKDEKHVKEIENLLEHKRKLMKKIHDISMEMSLAEVDQSSEQWKKMELCLQQKELKVQNLKRQIELDKECHDKKFTALATYSEKAIKKLSQVAAKGEQLLLLAERCHKLESEHEKLLPFYKSRRTDEEQNHLDVESTSEKLALVADDYLPLKVIWKRCNKVKLDCLCLKRLKRELMQENQQLKRRLMHCFDQVPLCDEL